MNHKIKSILFAAIVILGVTGWVGVSFADQITGTLTAGTNSSEATGTLTTGLNGSTGINGTVIVSPMASPTAGTYTSAQAVVLTASGASSINYTVDGSAPTCSTGNVYSGPISVGSSETINAISCYPENNASVVASFVYAINIPTVSGSSGGGGGGGGGGYIPPASTPLTTSSASTQSQGVILGASTASPTTLLQELQNLERQLVTIEFRANKCSFTFDTNLSKGMTDPDIKNLQMVLNYTSLTQVAVTGSGSPNNESTYFGNATKNAVIAFQNIFANELLTPNGMTSGNGYVGAATRKELNTLCGQ